MLVAGGQPSSRRPTTSALSKYPQRQAGAPFNGENLKTGKRDEKEKDRGRCEKQERQGPHQRNRRLSVVKRLERERKKEEKRRKIDVAKKEKWEIEER